MALVKTVSFSPYGGDTIKALQARQAALQQSSPELPAVQNMRSPWQGASYLANTLVNTLQQNAASSQEKTARDQLAQLISGHPEGQPWQNEELANIGQRDPDLMEKLMALQAATGKQEQWTAMPTPAGETGQWFQNQYGDTKKVGGGSETTGPKISDITAFRSQIMGDERYTMAANTIPIYRSMMQSAGQDDRTSDLDMVYGLAKMLDPTGVVRGEDAVMIQGNSPVADQIKAWADSLNADPNARLNPAIRKDIMALSYRRANEVAGAYKSFRDQSVEAAIANGIDPAKLGKLEFGEVLPYGEAEPPAPDPDVPAPDDEPAPEPVELPYPPKPPNWPPDMSYPTEEQWNLLTPEGKAHMTDYVKLNTPRRTVAPAAGGG